MANLSVTDITLFHSEEPRVLDVRLGSALGFERPRAIRQLIERNLEEIQSYGDSATRRGAYRGQPMLEYYLNEAQALLLCMFARTPRAAEVRKQIIEVFMAWRRGERAAAAIVPVKAHTRRVKREAAPAEDVIANIRRLRRCGMFSVRQIASLHSVTEEAVRAVSDECAIDLLPAVADVQKVGLIDEALSSLRALYEEMGRRLDDAEAAFHHGANNQHAIGSWN